MQYGKSKMLIIITWIKRDFHEHTYKAQYDYIEFKNYCINISANSKCFLKFAYLFVGDINEKQTDNHQNTTYNNGSIS
jgi:hypothetical protein